MFEADQPIFNSLISAIRASSQVAGQDIGFYRSLDTSLADSVGQCANRLLDLTSQVMQYVNPEEELDSIEDLESLEDNWSDVVRSLDSLYEKADVALDEFRAMKNGKASTIEINQENKMNTISKGKAADFRSSNSRTMEKPQLKFARAVDNSQDRPFKPLLTDKPYALLSLDESIRLIENNEDSEYSYGHYYGHPYEYEIKSQPYPVMQSKSPIPFKDWESTSYIYVDNQQKLNEMLEVLKTQTEIAVDLEHHDFRSYHGFVCLMQVSSREQDWIVDTLILRDELQILNQVFANPNIVKVFHGAFMDIIWLQRDFGLYVVGLFDTFSASKALGLKRHGLAYLLEIYARFQTSKKYQLADWRIRPIPSEMLSYARADTHFLLNIYDNLTNELIQSSKLDEVLSESRLVASKRYEIPGYERTDRWKNISLKYNLTRSQEIILQNLFSWRDKASQDHDESPHFLMPNHYMVALCINMPTDAAAVLEVANGATPFVRNSSKEIAKIIDLAKKKLIQDLNEQKAERDEHVEDVTIDPENYGDYKKSYDRAIGLQKSLFNRAKLQATIDKCLAPSSIYFRGLFEKDNLSSEAYKDRLQIALAKLKLYIPLPALSAQIIKEPTTEEEEVIVPESVTVIAETVDDENEQQEVEEKDVFEDGIIRLDAVSNDRKRKEMAEEMDEKYMNSKQKRKAKRKKLNEQKKEDKAKKRQSKQLDKDYQAEASGESSLQQGEAKSDSQSPSFAAYNYEVAPSVLQNTTNDKSSKKIFNPYGETSKEDTIKGAKMPKRPDGGQTLTFKKKNKSRKK